MDVVVFAATLLIFLGSLLLMMAEKALPIATARMLFYSLSVFILACLAASGAFMDAVKLASGIVAGVVLTNGAEMMHESRKLA